MEVIDPSKEREKGSEESVDLSSGEEQDPATKAAIQQLDFEIAEARIKLNVLEAQSMNIQQQLLHSQMQAERCAKSILAPNGQVEPRAVLRNSPFLAKKFSKGQNVTPTNASTNLDGKHFSLNPSFATPDRDD